MVRVFLEPMSRLIPMITFRTMADVTADRKIVVTLPPETPIGKAELVVTVAPQESAAAPRGSLRSRFGTVHSGDRQSADKERIDADLARAYGTSEQ
jgi:hypothetical protein